jgi:hypothetical protein
MSVALISITLALDTYRVGSAGRELIKEMQPFFISWVTGDKIVVSFISQPNR